MSKTRLYCRFCAEEKSYPEISALTSQDLKSLIEKLSLLGIYFIDFSNKMLPETVCITCYELLSISYEFFVKIKRSQVVLSELCGVVLKTEIKVERHDNEYLQDDHLSSFGVVQSLVEEKKYGSRTNMDIFMAGIDVSDEMTITEDTTETKPCATIKPTESLYDVENNCRINKLKLNNDIRSWAEYPAVCQFCQSKMSNKKNLTKHCVKMHKKCFGNKCVDCGSNIPCFKDFVEHVKKHRPHLKKICPYCNMDVGEVDFGHVEEHTKIRLSCTICGKTFRKMRDLRVHASKIEPSPFIKPLIKRPKGPFIPSDKDSTCGICGVVMKTLNSLKAHLLTHTERKRNHTCERCGKAFFTSSSLKEHRKIHEETLKETCKICLKTFLTKTRLKKHVMTHNLAMAFQCDECKKLFSSKDRLRQHVIVHTDVMPYQCKYCPKRFRFGNLKKTHENQHTGRRPFCCDICGKDFANWSNCNKHMKRKHGTTLAKTVKTPHGKIALNPATGMPEILNMDDEAKRWTEELLKVSPT